MASWDLYRCGSQTVERGLSTQSLRDALASGDVRDDDLVRPSGRKAPWLRLKDVPALIWPEDRIRATVKSALRSNLPPAGALSSDFDPPRSPSDDDSVEALPTGEPDALADQGSAEAIPVGEMDALIDDEDEDGLEEADEPLVAEPLDDAKNTEARTGAEDLVGALDSGFSTTGDLDFDYEDEDEEQEEFSLATGADEEEELDLTAMVDIAMQLIMFFLVTTATMIFKSIEIPNPDPEPQQNAKQAPKNLDELEAQNILVEIDANGQILVDHEPITPSELVPKLRAARDATGRTGMVLMADLATAHKNAVLAYDAATEVGLSIKIGRPSASPDL